MTEQIHDHPNPKQRWFHRRIQSYVCLLGLLTYPALFLLADSQHLAAVAWPVMLTLGGIVAAYHGFSTWETTKISGNIK